MSDYKITIDGILETEEMHVMGFSKYISFDKIKESSIECSKKLNNFISQGVVVEGPRISIVKGISEDFKSLFIIHGIMVELSEEANNILNEKDGIWAIIPPLPRVLKVTLTGSYDHLSETWQKTMEFISKNKLAVDKYANAWEVYVSEDKDNLITEIYVPLILTTDNDLDNLEF